MPSRSSNRLDELVDGQRPAGREQRGFDHIAYVLVVHGLLGSSRDRVGGIVGGRHRSSVTSFRRLAGLPSRTCSGA